MPQYVCQRPPSGTTIHVPYTIHCTQIQTVLHWKGFKDSSISADSGHERVGMMGVGAQMSCPHQGALVYIAACILVLKLHV